MKCEGRILAVHAELSTSDLLCFTAFNRQTMKMIAVAATIKLTDLRGRKARQCRQSKQIAARVVADEFDRKAKYRVDDAVCDQHLAVKFFVPV